VNRSIIRGARSGLRIAVIKIVRHKRVAKISPGIVPPNRSEPMLVLVSIP
jgi:hypothetical protein